MSLIAVRFPPQIKYIIGNEAAERFSYYGMASILFVYLSGSQYLAYSEADSEAIYHVFVAGVYLSTLVGAVLSDRYLGKYLTIISLSLVCVAGHATLAGWDHGLIFFVGLGLVAFGAGGFKPCVAAHVGDQFTSANKQLIDKVFGVFYMSINIGALAGTLLIPKLLSDYGPAVGFGVPGVLMALAALVFWLGRRKYVSVPPIGRGKVGTGRVLFVIIAAGADVARSQFGTKAVREAQAVGRAALVLIPAIGFWALFLQTGSSWVALTKQMDLHGFLSAAQLQFLNPALIMIFVPLFGHVVYPALQRRGRDVSPLARMRVGMFLTALSFVPVAGIQALADSGVVISAFFIVVPYIILTAAEILVSVTALEFAYTQAPRSAKSTLMSIWYLTIGIGSLLKAVVAKLNVFDGPWEFVFWAALMATVAAGFAVITRNYEPVEYVEPAPG